MRPMGANANCKEDYVLFDCPGQVELFTVHDSVRRIFKRLEKLGYRVRFLPCCKVFSVADTWI